MHLLDPLAWFIRSTPYFKGKSRIITYYARNCRRDGTRRRAMPGGGHIECHLDTPYEVMVWLRQEEEGELDFLRSLLRPGDTFIDCGANVGLWTLPAAAAVGSGSAVFAIEPSPSTFKRLEAHVGAHYPQVKLVNKAVGLTPGTVPFFCPAEHNLARVVAPDHPGAVLVPSETLDDIVEGRAVTGMKMDVEGFELDALKGGSEMLRRSRPWLIVEFNTIHAGVNRIGDWPPHGYLKTFGYQARLVTGPDTLDGPVLTDDWGCQGYRNIFYAVPR